MAVMITFYSLALIALVLGVMILTLKNPVHCAISLVGVMISLGGIFLLLGSPFVAAIQVLIYVGAIMVLFLFVIMLLNIKSSENEYREGKNRRILALFLGLLFLGQTVFISGAFYLTTPAHPAKADLHGLFIKLMTKYLLPFELASVLLLVAIVGAIIISLPQKDDKKTGEGA